MTTATGFPVLLKFALPVWMLLFIVPVSSRVLTPANKALPLAKKNPINLGAGCDELDAAKVFLVGGFVYRITQPHSFTLSPLQTFPVLPYYLYGMVALPTAITVSFPALHLVRSISLSYA